MQHPFKAYAGIGSRETPSKVLDLMRDLGREFAKNDWILRSGGAQGADSAFEEGADDAQGMKEIFIPWPGFQGRKDAFVVEQLPRFKEIMELAARHHPRWDQLRLPVKLLMARNGCQALGRNLNYPSELVVCWTPKGEMVGGTSQALRIAQEHGIRILNLAIPEQRATAIQLAG